MMGKKTYTTAFHSQVNQFRPILSGHIEDSSVNKTLTVPRYSICVKCERASTVVLGHSGLMEQPMIDSPDKENHCGQFL